MKGRVKLECTRDHPHPGPLPSRARGNRWERRINRAELMKILRAHKITNLLLWILLFASCGPSNPATLNEVSPPGSGTLAPDPFADPNAVLPGCILNFTSEISLAVDSAKTDVPHRQL